MALAVFNLVPLPPLDGSWIASFGLPRELGDAYDRFVRPYGTMILLVLVVTGGLGRLIGPDHAIRSSACSSAWSCPEMARPRILSGMRPTGALHLGHLTGALDNWVPLQDTYDCFYCIVDWHALTTDYADPSKIRESILEVALDWLAAGLDPKRSTLFVQSDVKEHAELHLLLSMVIPVPWLERVPTYKEQQQNLQEKDLSTYGFLGYPLLQSADIVIYKADAVPVGEDQAPHIELTREVVRRFNNFYGPVFPEPQTLLTPTPRMPGTDGRKMSKSYNNAIYLKDPPEVVRAKLKPMVTDPARDAPHGSRRRPRSARCSTCTRRSRRRPARSGRRRDAGARASAASTARADSRITCWSGSPASTPAARSWPRGRTRSGTSCAKGRAGPAPWPRRPWTTCARR